MIQGGNRTVTPGTLLLDGSSSYDPDGEALAFAWTCMQVEGGIRMDVHAGRGREGGEEDKDHSTHDHRG